ncbi:hypothetical protein bmLB2001_000253 [Borrelia miyamotoi]|uniref:hypothetical protein n=1 Tax=Borrelia miyamotoi TaxID=47466 RepID=UPI0003F8A923|nr:hypothetical protein [Borrelia miyamotoi]AGT27256.2 hypothetical protein I871_01390 [Borrelia miyamotoi LB-2001]AJA58440.1 hypothetical protein RJ61_01270 [Borrelia miyamotoi]AOW95518.1 hypothetical protein AXH25_01280 [Borrelia miyamotoi]QTL83402.1 hypothetical protein bmLB2001_000253 [Borrelia miyamotoi]WAZ92370.1 hypothetical protein O5402_02995 [Borrelia miyamotoi]
MEFLKGFVAIRLFDNEYFSILSLDDIAVKRVVLGKFADETNVKLDFYISEYKDFSNSIFIGSFFLDNLGKESSNINIYCSIDSMLLYVYGECDGITNKSKFDLKLINLVANSEELSSSLESVKSDDLTVSFSDLENGEGGVRRLEGILEQNQEDSSLDDLLDSVDNLLDSQNLFVEEKFSSNERNLNLLSNSLSSDSDTNDTLLDENLSSDSNLNLRNFDIGVTRDRFESSVDEDSEIKHDINEKEAVNQGDISDLGNVSVGVNNDIRTSSDDFDDWNVEDIITDLDKGFVENEFDNVALDDFSEEDFITGLEESRGSLNLEEGIIQTSMLYLSLFSLFLLIFFSLFLIFSKVLNHRNFAISCFSCYCFYKEEKINKYEKNNYV